jgi:BirA family biotin operon repressor/biotin-[acetyl-CoA-carboxylase] ligase
MNERILHIFLEQPGEFVSGEELSRVLNCSRTAIWKHIQNLRQQGYDFEAVPRKGYRLTKKPEILNVAGLLSRLTTTVMGRSIHYKKEVNSTQTLAHQMVAEGAEEGTVVIAEQQTEGRGTKGRPWYSPPGKGIWFSIVLKPHMPMQFISQLTLLVSVALCRAIKKTIPVNIGIKWPNDLLIEGKKVSGILLESSTEDERLRYVIAGIGISANLLTEDYPPGIRDRVTSLRMASGLKVNREELLCVFLEEFEHLYKLHHEEGFAPIRSLWEALSVSLDRPIEVESSQGRIAGIASGLDEMGALIVTSNTGQTVKIYSGDVNHINI